MPSSHSPRDVSTYMLYYQNIVLIKVSSKGYLLFQLLSGNGMNEKMEAQTEIYNYYKYKK